MAAATVSTTNYTNGRKPAGIVGYMEEFFRYTVPTTSLDDIGDGVRFFKVRHGMNINKVVVGLCDDLDSGAGALDMDVVLVDDNGTTILYNAGTAFASARTTPLIVAVNNVSVVDTAGTAYVGLYVNTAASTPAHGSVDLTLGYNP